MKNFLKLIAILLFVNSNCLAQNLKDYLGAYSMQNAPFSKLIISQKDGKLIANAEGVGQGELAASTVADKFHEPTNNADIEFKRDSSAQVTKLIVYVQGSEFVGTKENEFLGFFVFDSGSPIADMKVTLKNNNLFAETAQGSAVLKPTAKPDEFEVVGYHGVCIYKRNAEGAIIGVTLNVTGSDIFGKKQ